MALSAATTFLTFADFNSLNAIKDMIIPANNLAQVVDGNAMQPSVFKADRSPPSLVNFTMNMNSGILNMTFSEPCDASTVNVSAIVLQNQAAKVTCNAYGQCSIPGQTASSSHKLSPESSKAIDSDGLTLLVSIGVDDLNAIKVIDGFYDVISTSFLAAREGMVSDISDFVSDGVLGQNGVLEIPQSAAMLAASWSPDVTDPKVDYFTLNMNTGVLSLTFVEPVRVNSFNGTGIKLHGDANNNVNTSTVHLSEETFTTSPNGLTVKCQISYDDLNLLKASTSFVSPVTTFLETLPRTIDDMAGNPLAMANPSVPTKALLHSADTTKPKLLSFDFDPVNHNFTFHFDEVVSAASFDPTGIVIQDAAFSTQELALVDSKSVSGDGISISAYFGPTDVANFDVVSFFTTSSNSFVRLTNAAFKDVASVPNYVSALTDGSALQIGPTLFMFSINMDSGTIELRFSEPVDVKTVVPSKITLQDAAIAKKSHTLTGSVGNYTKHDLYTVGLHMTKADIDAVKVTSGLCYGRSTCYVTVDAGAIYDYKAGSWMGPNPLLALSNGEALQAYAMNLDRTEVELASFSLNMNLGTLTLYFNEPVLAKTLDATKITLHGSRDGTASSTDSVTLSAASTTASPNGNQIVLNIERNGGLDQDFDRIGYARQLATSASNTFISLSADTIIDTSQLLNKVSAIKAANSTKVHSFTPDTTHPTLQRFDLDMNVGEITLTFSEAVWVDSTFDVTSITLLNHGSAHSVSFALTADSRISDETVALAGTKSIPAIAVVKITLGENDKDSIKSFRQLASDASSTFVAAGASLTKDISTSNNTFVAIPEASALQVTSYTVDTVSPNLISYNLDMDAGLLTFTFDEIVDPLSLDPTQIRLQYAKFTGTNEQQFTLTSSTLTGSSSTGTRSLGITLSADDLNNVKLKMGMATKKANTYAVISASFVADMASNPVSALIDGKSLLVTSFVPDTTRPFIKSFQIKSNGKIKLKFSESVLTSAFNSSGLVIQTKDYSATHRLTSHTVITTSASLSTELTLTMGQDFLDAQLANVATAQLTSYMSCSEYTITDISGNSLIAIAPQNAVLMGPALESFDLDMNKRFITMRFSEALTGNFTAASITLYSAQAGKYSYTLTDWNFTKSPSDPKPHMFIPTESTVKAFLSAADVSAIKKRGGLATTADDTYLGLSSSTPLAYNSDQSSVGAPLFVVPIVAASAMKVTSFTPDVVPPNLLSYDLNKNSGTLTLRFDEPVNLKTFNTSGIVVQSKIERGSGLNFVILQGSGTKVVGSDGTGGIGASTIQITLGMSDLGKVLSLDLGSYLTMTKDTAKDMSIPPLDTVPIVDGSAMAVTLLTPDTTGPNIQRVDIDLELGLLTITFSEPVDASTFKPSLMSLQGVASSPNGALGMYNFTDDTVITSNVERTMVLDMSIFRTDLDGVKSSMLNGVATRANTTFLSILPGAFKDYNNNDGAQIYTSAALEASSYVPDTVKPLLKSFDLEVTDSSDPKYGKLTLHFSEPVDPTSIVFGSITLSNGASSSDDTASKTLSSSTVATNVATSSIDINLHSSELTYVKGQNWASTFLTVLADSATDVSGNTLNPVDHVMIGPVLEYSTFSMADGKERIAFIFSEPVNPATFHAPGITIHDSVSGGASYSLTASSNLTASTLSNSATKVLTINIGADDVLALKEFDTLAVSTESTLIALKSTTVRDVAGTPNPVVPIPQITALQVNNYVADAAVPNLLDVVLDLGNNDITFFFDEPVKASKVMTSQITLQSTSDISSSAEKWTLGDTTYVGGNNATVHMVLGFNDMSAIKSRLNLCTATSNCYMSFLADTFIDTASIPNSLPFVSSGAARKVDYVLKDTVAPTLASFGMNLDEDTLTLNFDEPVFASSFKPWKLSMQNSMTNIGTPVYHLPGAATTKSPNGATLVVNLPVSFVEEILLDTTFAIDRVTLFIMLEAGSVTDTSGNNVTEIINGYSQPAKTFVPDTTPPSLVEFKLDMNSGTATLVFQEFVRIQDVNIGKVSITNDTSASAISHSLLLGTALQQTKNNTKSVVLVMSPSELNVLKDYTQLATSSEDSFIVLGGNAVKDMGNNGNVAMDNAAAFKCTTYNPDSTPPVLQGFDMNLDQSRITLRFSETVDPGTFAKEGLKLHNFATKMYGNVFDLISPTLTAGSGSDSGTVYIDLSRSDMASVKDKGIGLDGNTTWLSMEGGSIKDMSGLDVEAVLETGIIGGSSMQVTNLFLDLSRPTLDKWRLDRSLHDLHLHFTEPVTIVDLEKIRVSSGFGNNVQMTNATFEYENDGTSVVIDLDSKWEWHGVEGGKAKLNRVEMWNMMEGIGADDKEGAQLSLTMSEGAVKDKSMNPNFNSAIVNVPENFPDCSCPAGKYVKEPCTDVNDAVCEVCSDCAALGGYYQSGECSANVDTECTICTPCNHGYYPSLPCGGKSDNVCSVCTECGDMEYETSTCQGGVNRICATCKVCQWLNSAQEEACISRSKSWRNENCCFDKKGVQVKCGNVDFVNLEIEARNGRHHWVFPDTTPAIVGYKLGEWNGD